MELVPPQGRVIGNTLISLCYVFGSMTVAGLAWLFNDWRTLLRVIYAPSGFIFSYLWILNENPRWLIRKGRHEEAVNILKKAAKINKVVLSDSALASIENQAKENFNNITKCRQKNEDDVGKNSQGEVKNNSSLFIRVLKSRIITGRVIVCSFLFTTCSFVYYGLSINSVSLAGNLYMNFIMVSFIEVPATFCYLFISDRYGRKKVLITTYILSAVFCISLSFVPKDSSWLWPLIIFLAGKFTIAIAFNTIYVFVSELFPTNARQSLLAVCSSVSTVGSALAPLTPLIALYNENLPSIIFGAVAVIAALLVFTLPETLNLTLPDTIEEAERLSREKKTRQSV